MGPVLVKLTERQIEQIPALRAAGMTVQQIADLWGVSPTVIVSRGRAGYHAKTEPQQDKRRRKSGEDKK